jgi:hypothetical protein
MESGEVVLQRLRTCYVKLIKMDQEAIKGVAKTEVSSVGVARLLIN